MTTYKQFEISVDDGLPVELYEIAYSSKVWRYTTNVEDVDFEGNKYFAIAIKRGETEDNSDATKANMEIHIARDSEIGSLFTVTAPSEPITITIRQYHALLGYQQPNQQVIAVWKGRVTNVSWQGSELVLTAESVFSSMLRLGATRKYSRMCSHVLYGEACGVNRANFTTEQVAASVVGTVLSIPHGQDADWWAGGYISYTNHETGAAEFRQIVASTPNTITLNSIPIGLKAGVTSVKLYAGCDHRLQTCKAKFDNAANYGGQPFIPLKNPFGGSNLY